MESEYFKRLKDTGLTTRDLWEQIKIERSNDSRNRLEFQAAIEEKLALKPDETGSVPVVLECSGGPFCDLVHSGGRGSTVLWDGRKVVVRCARFPSAKTPTLRTPDMSPSRTQHGVLVRQIAPLMPDMPQGPLNLPAPHDDAAAAGTLNNDDWISAISNLLARGETIIWQHLKDSKWQWKKGTGLAATYFYYPPGVSKASVQNNAVEGRK